MHQETCHLLFGLVRVEESKAEKEPRPQKTFSRKFIFRRKEAQRNPPFFFPNFSKAPKMMDINTMVWYERGKAMEQT
jgi:hypothetical protein